MKILLPVLLCCTLAFTGCISFFESISFHPDGSISVGRDIGMDQMFFTLTDSFSKILEDSTDTETPKRNMLDSMRSIFFLDKAKLSSIPGYISYSEKDTTLDGFHHFIAEIRIKDTTGISAAKRLLYPDSSKSKRGADNGLSMSSSPLSSGKKKGFMVTVHTVPGKTLIDVDFAMNDSTETKKKKKKSKSESQLEQSLFSKFEFGYKVFSPNLQPTSDPFITNLVGGQEWKIPIKEILESSSRKVYHHQFIITQ